MEVNDQLVEKLADLATLQFNQDEKAEIKKDLQKMIGFVEKLIELDVSAIEPLMHITEEVNVLRDDEVKESLSREEGLKNAVHDGKYFKTPKVLKNPNDHSPDSG